jgi:hypothetical protein
LTAAREAKRALKPKSKFITALKTRLSLMISRVTPVPRQEKKMRALGHQNVTNFHLRAFKLELLGVLLNA